MANLDTGLFYSLAGSAAAIWAGLVAGLTERHIAEAFAAGGGDAPYAEVERFVAGLVAEKLLVVSETPVPAPAEWSAPAPFVPPTMERFDDLQGLLLVDPIHDVSDAGWPMLPPSAADTDGA